MAEAITINTQQGWGWKIAAYLFLAGAGAGTSLAGFGLDLFYPDLMPPGAGALIGVALVILGLMFLVGDLGKKSPALLAFSRPGASWISRGVIVITIFVVLALLYTGMEIWLGGASGLHLVLGSLTAFFALLTLLYTGLALGMVKSVPFWNACYVPVLFTVSGISTGIMILALYLAAYVRAAGADSQAALAALARFDALVIIIAAFVMAFYLSGRYRAISASNSLVLMFWLGVAVAGLALPLALEVYLGYLSAAGPALTLVLRVVVCLLGLGGGFMLRYVIVAGGSGVPLNVNGVAVPLPVSRIRIFR